MHSSVEWSLPHKANINCWYGYIPFLVYLLLIYKLYCTFKLFSQKPIYWCVAMLNSDQCNWFLVANMHVYNVVIHSIVYKLYGYIAHPQTLCKSVYIPILSYFCSGRTMSVARRMKKFLMRLHFTMLAGNAGSSLRYRLRSFSKDLSSRTVLWGPNMVCLTGHSGMTRSVLLK